MEFSEDTLFAGVLVKRGDQDGPAIAEILVFEHDGEVGVSFRLPDDPDSLGQVLASFAPQELYW